MQTVTLQDLSKTYSGGKEAVKEISLSLEQGEVFGFLGPNGAGKTTTVKLLNGMLAPTSGKYSVMGSDPAREPEKVHAVSGVLTEHARMYDNMTGLQNLVFYAAIFGIPEQEGNPQTRRPLASHPPPPAPGVLFLDEPTSGLDPESAQNVNRLIQKLAEEEKTTVFLCTHQLRYAQEICTRYGLIDEGRLLAAGTLGELREKAGPGAELRIRAGNIPEGMKLPGAAAGRIRQKERKYGKETGTGASELEYPGNILRIKIRSEEEIPGIVKSIVGAGGDIYEVEVRRPSLEDIYFTLTGKEKEGGL